MNKNINSIAFDWSLWKCFMLESFLFIFFFPCMCVCFSKKKKKEEEAIVSHYLGTRLVGGVKKWEGKKLVGGWKNGMIEKI